MKLCASPCRRRGFHPTIDGHHRTVSHQLAPKGGKVWWGIDVGTLAPQPVSLVRETARGTLARPARRFRNDLRYMRANRMESRLAFLPDVYMSGEVPFRRDACFFANFPKIRRTIPLLLSASLFAILPPVVPFPLRSRVELSERGILIRRDSIGEVDRSDRQRHVQLFTTRWICEIRCNTRQD